MKWLWSDNDGDLVCSFCFRDLIISRDKGGLITRTGKISGGCCKPLVERTTQRMRQDGYVIERCPPDKLTHVWLLEVRQYVTKDFEQEVI